MSKHESVVRFPVDARAARLWCERHADGRWWLVTIVAEGVTREAVFSLARDAERYRRLFTP